MNGMAGAAGTLVSLAAAGALLVTGALQTAAPQNDADSDLFLVNRQWRISESYEPELTTADVPGQLRQLRPEAASALEELFAACREETGVSLSAVSGFRDYAKQSRLYQRKLKQTGGDADAADAWVARPGASEHQTGRAMDVGQLNGKGTLTADFADTEGGRWLAENCWRFGFILRYQAGWEDITGYRWEPWHIRYVGREAAASLHRSGEPFETWLLRKRKQILLELLDSE